MRVSHVEVADTPKGARLSARIEWDRAKRRGRTIEFTYHGIPAADLPTPGDALVAALFAPCAVTDEDLHLDVTVSSRLLQALGRIAAIWSSWVPRWHRVSVEAPAADRSHLEPTAISAGFSGGVDSFFTVLRPRDEPVTTLVTIKGLVTPGGEWTDELLPELAGAARELGLDHLVVETDVAEFAASVVPPWSRVQIGWPLAAVPLALGGRIRRHLIAASAPLWRLYPSGSHPATDPLWSTEALEIVHDGAEYSRVEKTFAVAHSDIALRHLNLDAGSGPPPDNCRVCEKCQLTALVLHQCGTLARCPQLGPVTPGTLRRTHIGTYLDAFEEARHRVDDSGLRRAVAVALRRSRLRKRARPLGTVLRRLRLRRRAW